MHETNGQVEMWIVAVGPADGKRGSSDEWDKGCMSTDAGSHEIHAIVQEGNETKRTKHAHNMQGKKIAA